MLVTMILVAALLAGAAVLVSLQMSSNKSTDLTRAGMSSLYCAEAGLAASRTAVATNSNNWNTALATASAANNYRVTPTWLGSSAFSHDIDGIPGDDFVVAIMDDDDETSGTNNKTVDINQRVYIVSTCTKYPDNQQTVMELVEYQGGATCYAGQEGGCNGRGNVNN